MRVPFQLMIGLGVLALPSSALPIAAPVPKEKPAVSIEGKYTLLSVVNDDAPALRGKGVAPAAAGRGSIYLSGPAVITKNEINLEGSGRVMAAGMAGPTVMEYVLDSTKSPMEIDVESVNLRGKKTKLLGAAEVVGRRLIIALAKEGDPRPKTTEEADGVTVYFFQKAPPPPKTEYRIVAMSLSQGTEVAEKELNKLAQEGFELLTTTQPVATDAKASPTTIHFVLRRTGKP